MTKTARDLRSAAHALRTAANALEETVTALRALSDDLNKPDPEPEPAPVWPTAQYVWWDGYLWEPPGGGWYVSMIGDLHSPDLADLDPDIRDEAIRFAREAVPVTLVPSEAWETWKSWVPSEAVGACAGDRELVNAVDSLAQEVAR